MSEEADILNSVLIADRYRVDLGQPLPELDSPCAFAFSAVDQVRPESSVFVLVQKSGIPRREAVFKILSADRVARVMCPLAQGLVRFDSEQKLAIVLNRPEGGRAFPDGLKASLTERQLRSQFLPQIIESLSALHMLGIAHRGLCPANLFYQDVNCQEIILGECFTSPPGMTLAPGYEPIESASAIPEGRGEGDVEHDMFSLGTLVMSLYAGLDLGAMPPQPAGELFEQQMIARIRQGSYRGLGGGREVTGSLSELLRGLLDDRPDKRWDVDDVKRWLEGIPARTQAADERWALVRPVSFGGKTIHDRRHLAHAMGSDIPAAAAIIRNGKFLHWIQNALVEALGREWLDSVLDTRPAASAGRAGGSVDEVAVALVCAVLDPNGPIQFRGMRVCPDGIGYALAVAMATGNDVQIATLRALLDGAVLPRILNILRGRNNNLSIHQNRLSDASRHMSKATLGFGLERALYTLNPLLACQSARLNNFYVDSLARLLKAMEQNAEAGKAGAAAIDPHSAAFIARQSREMEEIVRSLDLAKMDPERFASATLKLLGTIQQQYYSYELPHLSRLLSEPIRKAISELHGKSMRRHLEARLKKLVEAGDLARIGVELNFLNLKLQDSRGFQAAQRQFELILREKQRLERPVTGQDPEARRMGASGALYASYATLLASGAYVLFSQLV